MLSYVLNAASSYVKYTPLGPHFATTPAKVTPTNNAIVNSPREASESKLFDSPSTTSSPSTSTASSREPSACDSSSDSSDASTSSSSSRQSSTASNISGSSASSSRASRLQPTDDTNDSNRYAIIEDVLRHENLYEVLGVTKTADLQALRRGYLTRSKRCHPDKFPENPLATLAFQKVTFAYETLSDPSSRRTYDRALASARHNARRGASSTEGTTRQYHPSPDDTLNAVLYGVFCDFMDGDCEIIRTLLKAVGEINQRMAMGDDTIESLLQSLMRLREVLLVGRKYVRIIRFELIRMYEIQHNLRQLSYFDVRGRLRLTLQLARVGLSLPVVVDTAMRSEDEDGSSDSECEEDRRSTTRRRRRERSARASDPGSDGRARTRTRVRLEKVEGRRRRGLLPPPVSVVIGLAIGALEIGESVL